MAKSVVKKGEKPKIEVEIRDTAVKNLNIKWKREEFENGLILWSQTRSIPESRDIRFHTYNESRGWSVSFNEGMAWTCGHKTPDDAIRECERIVRFRMSKRHNELRNAER